MALFGSLEQKVGKSCQSETEAVTQIHAQTAILLCSTGQKSGRAEDIVD